MQPSLPPSHPFFLPLVVSSKIKSQHQEIGARNCAAHTTTKNPLQGNPDFTISHFTSPSTGKSQWKSPTERGISLSLSPEALWAPKNTVHTRFQSCHSPTVAMARSRPQFCVRSRHTIQSVSCAPRRASPREQGKEG